MHWLNPANSLGEAMGGGKEEGGAWLRIARGIAQGGGGGGSESVRGKDAWMA